jgi:polyhydroxybutyrate depolymerase
VKIRKLLLGAVLVIVGLPVLLVLIVMTTLSLLDRTNGSIQSSGQKREYLLHVPQSYDPAKPTPLLISMHGAAAWPAQQMNTSRWNRLADEHGFIVVYPSGSDSPKIWHIAGGAGLTKDVRFISELIDALAATYNIDSTRIYADGLSAGGGMAFVLSCALSQRIAAVGLVAAAEQLPFSWCTADRPVPMIEFHGTADPFVPYGGGVSQSPFAPTRFDKDARPFPSILAWTGEWARRNRCAADPVKSVIAADVTRLEYTDCAEGAAVVLYSIDGGGHTWPGGKPFPKWMMTGSTSSGVDATRRMWEFFREHPKLSK